MGEAADGDEQDRPVQGEKMTSLPILYTVQRLWRPHLMVVINQSSKFRTAGVMEVMAFRVSDGRPKPACTACIIFTDFHSIELNRWNGAVMLSPPDGRACPRWPSHQVFV